ncbi:hypothetical protein [Candidatus Pantoea bituminis]|uniref:hypothetical protein n=1 Tax=Candidatus Pantoea bituminis TaxID=2831036 RepID=UPI00208E7348|nr:hypothetical protein [Pantoea bituminis]
MKFARLALLLSGITGTLLTGLSSAHAATDPVTPTASDFAAMTQCKTLQTKYTSLVGKEVVVGLGATPKASKRHLKKIPVL